MSTQDKVFEITTEHLGAYSTRSMTITSSLREDLAAYNLDTVEIIMALEKEFSIEISNDELEKIFTMQDMISLMESLL